MGQKNSQVSITFSDPYQKCLRKPGKGIFLFFQAPLFKKLLTTRSGDRCRNTRSTATHGASKPIAIDGAGADDSSADGRWRLPNRTAYITRSQPPAPMLHGRYLHSWKSVGAKRRTALETSRRELSEDVWFRVGTIGTGALLVVEQSSLENRPRVGAICIHRPIRYFVFFSCA